MNDSIRDAPKAGSETMNKCEGLQWLLWLQNENSPFQEHLRKIEADFEGVALGPLDAGKPNTFRERGINRFVVLSLKVTHERVKEEFHSRCFCNPVGLLHSKGWRISLSTSAFPPCYKNDVFVLSFPHRLTSSG